MGIFQSKIIDNKVVELKAASMQTSLAPNSDVLTKYMKYLNDSGFLLVKINLINANKLGLKVWNKTKFPNMPENELSKLPGEIKDFKKKNRI